MRHIFRSTLVALVLAGSHAFAQRPRPVPDPAIEEARKKAPARELWQVYIAPFIGGGFAMGAGGAICSCGSGGSFAGAQIGASKAIGVELSRGLAIGYESSGGIQLLADQTNQSNAKLLTVRVRPREWIAVAGGIGSARYHLGDNDIIGGAVTFMLGVETGSGVHWLQGARFIEVVISDRGSPQGEPARQYHLRELRIGYKIRLRGPGYEPRPRRQ